MQINVENYQSYIYINHCWVIIAATSVLISAQELLKLYLY